MTTNVPLNLEVDEYSLSARAALFCFGDQGLGIGTVFFWEHNSITYLVTNWHNATGINPITGANIHDQGGKPTNFEVSILRADGSATFDVRSYELYDADDKPMWLIHPEHGRSVDVVAMPLLLPPGTDVRPINKIKERPLKFRVGHDLFVLGFPFSRTIFDRGGMPTWKRASLASEPSLTLASELYCLVDTATRPGMSGSPVIRRAYSGAEHEDGSISLSGGSRFFGIYAGRVAGPNTSDAQLGRVYERKLLEQIIVGNVRDKGVEKPPGSVTKVGLTSMKLFKEGELKL